MNVSQPGRLLRYRNMMAKSVYVRMSDCSVLVCSWEIVSVG